MTSEMMPSDVEKIAERMYCGAAGRLSAEGTILSWQCLQEHRKREWIARAHDAFDAMSRTPAPAGELAALAEAWVEADSVFNRCPIDDASWAALATERDAARAALHTALSAHLAEVRAAIGHVSGLAQWVPADWPDDAMISHTMIGNIELRAGDLRRLAALAKKLEG